jgi:hypothetical protein
MEGKEKNIWKQVKKEETTDEVRHIHHLVRCCRNGNYHL